MLKLHREGDLDETTPQYPNTRIFSTNCPFDFLLFVTAGSSVKVMNILTGKTITKMPEIHFKGTYNFGIIMDEGPTSKLHEVLKAIGDKVATGGWKPLPKGMKTPRGTPSRSNGDEDAESVARSIALMNEDLNNVGSDYAGEDLLKD